MMSCYRSHQANHRSGHPELRSGDRGNKCLDHLHHLPCGPKENPRHQTSLPRYDRQEHEEILHIRSAGNFLDIHIENTLLLDQNTVEVGIFTQKNADSLTAWLGWRKKDRIQLKSS